MAVGLQLRLCRTLCMLTCGLRWGMMCEGCVVCGGCGMDGGGL